MFARRVLFVRPLYRSMSTGTNATNSQISATDDDLYRRLHVKCSAHEEAVLDSYEKFVTSAASHLEIELEGTEAPRRVIKRKTMLASRFVHKKYRVQYEVRNHYRNLTFKNLTGSTMDTFLEYIERNLPEGVLMIAEKHRLAELPFDLTSEQDSKSQEAK